MGPIRKDDPTSVEEKAAKEGAAFGLKLQKADIIALTVTIENLALQFGKLP